MIDKENTEAVGKNAYLAGLIDGDGCIYAARRNRNTKGRNGKTYATFMYFLTLELTMCSKETIDWVHRNFGGSVCVQKSRTDRPYFHLRIYNDSAVEVLKKIYPFLITKKRQAALAFKYREVIKQSAWQRDSYRYSLRDDLIAEIRSLNERWSSSKAVETVREAPAKEMIQSEPIGDDRSDLGDQIACAVI